MNRETMNCREALDRAPLAAGGDLPSDEAAELAAHLACCAECAVVVARETEIHRTLIARLRPTRPVLPTGFWDGFAAGVIAGAFALEGAPRAFAPTRPDLPHGFWDGFNSGVISALADLEEARSFAPERPELPADFWGGFSDALMGAVMHAAIEEVPRAFAPSRPELPAGFLAELSFDKMRELPEEVESLEHRHAALAPSRPALPADFWESHDGRHPALEPVRPELPANFWDGFSEGIRWRLSAEKIGSGPRRRELSVLPWLAAAAALLIALVSQYSGPTVAPLIESADIGKLEAPQKPKTVAPYKVRVVKRSYVLENGGRVRQASETPARSVIDVAELAPAAGMKSGPPPRFALGQARVVTRRGGSYDF